MFIWRVRDRVIASGLIAILFTAVIPGNLWADSLRVLSPSEKFSGLEQGELEIKSLHGRYAVIQFFASWCAGCGYTMPNVAKISEASHIRYVPVSIDDSAADGQKFFDKGPPSVQSFRKLAYWDRSGIASRMGIRGPAVLIFDPRGTLIKTYTGHMKGREMADLEASLQRCREKESKEVKQAKIGTLRALWFWVFQKVFLGEAVGSRRSLPPSVIGS